MKTKAMMILMSAGVLAASAVAKAEDAPKSWYCSARCVLTPSDFKWVVDKGTVRGQSSASMAEAFSKAERECEKRTRSGALARKVEYSEGKDYPNQSVGVRVEYATPVESCVEGKAQTWDSGSGPQG